MSQIVTPQGFVPDRFPHAPVPLAEYAGEPALLVAPDTDPDAIAPHFASATLIVIPFPTSADGRGFSLAAALRERGYRGHLRASGHVLVDQFRAALRCGFDDIEISDAQALRNPASQWVSVPLTQGYQAQIFSGKRAL